MIDFKFSEEFLNKRLIRVKRYEAENYELSHIYEYGYFPSAKYHYFKRESGADEHILILCSYGEGTVEIGRNSYKITPKMYVIIPKGVSHTYYANNQNPWSIYWFHFQDELVETPIIETLSAIKYNAVNAVFQFMMQITPKTKKDILYLNTIYKYISHTLQYQIRTTIKNNHVELAIQYMSENLSKQITLFDIANYSGVSISQLSLLFKKHVGVSPFLFFLNLKVEEASNLLLSTNLSIGEISSSLGFEDQFYFSRLFKRHMGVSPRVFKSANTQSNT
jgi:AraC family transcriptional regulator, arabinose operon regulatory protein